MNAQPPSEPLTILARHNLDTSFKALLDALNALERSEQRCDAALDGAIRELREGRDLNPGMARSLAIGIDQVWKNMKRDALALHAAQQQFNVDVIRVLEK